MIFPHTHINMSFMLSTYKKRVKLIKINFLKIFAMVFKTKSVKNVKWISININISRMSSRRYKLFEFTLKKFIYWAKAFSLRYYMQSIIICLHMCKERLQFFFSFFTWHCRHIITSILNHICVSSPRIQWPLILTLTPTTT